MFGSEVVSNSSDENTGTTTTTTITTSSRPGSKRLQEIGLILGGNMGQMF